jgi:hypothetical protein
MAREIIEGLRRELQRPRQGESVRGGESTLPQRTDREPAAQTSGGSQPVTALHPGMKAVEDMAA